MKVDGWLIFIAGVTTTLGYEISFEAAAYLFSVGFSYFGIITGIIVCLVGAVGWGIWRERVGENSLMLRVVLGAGLIGSLSGILKGLFG